MAKIFPLLTALFLNLFLIGCSYPTYSINFYDDNLDLNYAASIIGEANISLPTLISDNNLSTPLYLASSSTDISTNTALEVTKNINLYAIQNVQEITTQEELAAINTNTTTLTGKYILLNNITLDENKAGFDNQGWFPIGSFDNFYAPPSIFKGIFNGNNNTITNLWVNTPYVNNIGLFGYIVDAQIKNLGVKIAEGKGINGNYRVGGIVGYAYRSSITDSSLDGNINGDNWVGGIAGSISSGSITNSSSDGNISGYGSVGGIAGYVDRSNITNSYSIGNVNGYNRVGGIAGSIGESSITNSYSIRNVNGDEYVGGIAGSIIESSITNSYSAGSISGNNWVGGIAGYTKLGTIQNNAAINPFITGGTNYINRVIGYVDYSNTILNNFALSTMSGNFTVSEDIDYHGTDKTDNELKTQTTYSDDIDNGGLGWKFGNDNDNPWVWSAFEGYPYPMFYWQK